MISTNNFSSWRTLYWRKDINIHSIQNNDGIWIITHIFSSLTAKLLFYLSMLVSFSKSILTYLISSLSVVNRFLIISYNLLYSNLYVLWLLRKPFWFLNNLRMPPRLSDVLLDVPFGPILILIDFWKFSLSPSHMGEFERIPSKN